MAKTIEIKGLDEALHAIGEMRTVAHKAVSTSINRTATHTRSQVSIAARDQTTVKAAYAKQGITIPYKSSPNRIGSKVVVSGKRIPLIGYQARQTKKGVSGRIFKAEPLILRPRAFIASMKSGHKGVFWREKRFAGGAGRQGDRWQGDLRSFYIMLNAIKRKYPGTNTKDLVVRLGITELYGPALPDLIKNDLVWKQIQKDADEYLHKQLDQNFSYYMDQLK